MAKVLKDSEQDLGKNLLEQIKGLAGSWPSYAALGSFLLYVAGYLALRFHFTVLGLGTDLTVLDERYLFAGAKFLVYAVSSIPVIVLLALLLFAAVTVPGKGLLIILPQKATTWSQDRWKAWCKWWAKPNHLAWAGIIFSVMLIQFVMRQCYFLNNLLIAKEATGPAWLLSLIVGENWWRELYFPGLVAGTVLTGVFCWRAKRIKGQTILSQRLISLLAVLWSIQFLFLPVNYGTLIMDQTVPRVAKPTNWPEVKQDQQIWLVSEGKNSITYLTRGKQAPNTRSLVTLKKNAVLHTEIFCYDRIIPVIFNHETLSCSP